MKHESGSISKVRNMSDHFTGLGPHPKKG